MSVKVACVQMQCCADRLKNIEKAENAVRTAAQQGAKVILLPELFERPYFCQERRYDYYEYAERTEDNLAVQRLQKLSAELNVALPVSFYEKDGNVFYNSVAMLDGGKLLGVYRKTHIPDDHYYQEKFYFTPGNTGFKVFATQFGNVGVGICWDQWFPETARCLALNGADIILYPTAIGSEPILSVDSAEHWQRVMQGHSAANVLPVAAANRIGTESVVPCGENGGQTSSLAFYGSSFLTDATGKIVAGASREKEQILYAEYGFAEIERQRREWGLFRDRRPEMYAPIVR
ncbi:MAG TPA: N-carbamoylputrescine amidase [Candidatus Borkfalkia excrementipullorum]|nr:N-carbamoylputrescine amidase [Candidatus Borkfalkia excrementipullorum]